MKFVGKSRREASGGRLEAVVGRSDGWNDGVIVTRYCVGWQAEVYGQVAWRASGKGSGVVDDEEEEEEEEEEESECLMRGLTGRQRSRE